MPWWLCERPHITIGFALCCCSEVTGDGGVGEGGVWLRLPNYQCCVKMKPQLVSDRMAWFYIRRHHSHRCDNLHHTTRGHITHATPGRVSADCLCEALTCFLMGFGEWPAAGHFESSHDWPIHIFHLLLPRTKPATKSFCSFIFFFGHMLPSVPSARWHICWAPAITGTQKWLTLASAFMFPHGACMRECVVSLTVICGWIKTLLIQQSFPSYPSRWWGHACGLIITGLRWQALIRNSGYSPLCRGMY